MVRLLTAKEVSTLFNVPLARVYELARRRQIPTVRLGRRQVRFDVEMLSMWIQGGGPTSKGQIRQFPTDQSDES